MVLSSRCVSGVIGVSGCTEPDDDDDCDDGTLLALGWSVDSIEDDCETETEGSGETGRLLSTAELPN